MSTDEGEILSDIDSVDEFAKKDRSERDRSRSEEKHDTRQSQSKPNRDKSRERSDRDRDYNKYNKKRDDRRSRSRDRLRSRDSSRGRHDRRRRRKHKSGSSRYRRYSSDSRSSSSRSGGGGHRRRRSRSRSYDSYSSNDSRSYYSDYYSERGNQDRSNDSNYKHQEPNSTVMVRGLASHLTEQDIRQDILKCGIMVKDIRLIRHRDTGASRGFAFVEFQTVQEAIRYMEMKQGSLVLQDEYHATLIYSVPKVPYIEKRTALSDWYCSKCQGHNFKRREFCYKCHNPRPDDQDPELSDELSSHPTTTIILYNLDALTTEEGILQAFKIRPSLALIPIKSVRVAREAVTNLSRGMCYVETNNVTDSVRLYTILVDDPLMVDNRQAAVAYSKPASHGPTQNVANVVANALAAAQWGKSQSQAPPDEDAIENMAQYSASLYATKPEEYASYLEYYREYYRKHPLESILPGTSQDPQEISPSSSSAPNSSLIKSSSGSLASDMTRTTDETKTAPIASDKNADVADTSRFQYDEASGYYYDPVSGLYYDAQSQYYYDATKQQYLYWSQEQGQYIAVTDSSTNPAIAQSVDAKKGGATEKKKDKKAEKQDKVKVAKKIAKDMEKWAKTLNQKKDGTKMPVVPESSYSNTTDISNNQIEGLSNTIATSYSYRLSDISTSKPSIVTSQNESLIKTPLVASYGDESDSEEETKPSLIESPISDDLVDFQKLACLLCKRQFPNKDVLIKHTKLSELHKKNLELRRSKYSMASYLEESSSKPRDRARERREKFGSDPSEGKNSLKDLYMQTKKDINFSYHEEPTKEGIKADNIGNKMLQRMGWEEGQGLGRGNSGMTSIITSERRQKNTGLGLRVMPVVDEEDRYCRARKLTLARYQELE